MAFLSDYPGAIVVEAAQYGYPKGARNNHPKAWCLHTPEEVADSQPSTPYYFHNTTRNASTTYFVSYLGLVFQCVPESEGAYANAVEGKPYPVWPDSKVNLNLQTLSIEIEGYAATIHQTMPRGSPQWKALVNLMAHRCKALNIPPGRTFGHYQVSVNRSDPGQLNIPLLVADVIAETEEDMALTQTEFNKMFLAAVNNLKFPARDDAGKETSGGHTAAQWAEAAHLARVQIIAHTADVAKHAGGTGGVSEARVKEIVRELVAD